MESEDLSAGVAAYDIIVSARRFWVQAGWRLEGGMGEKLKLITLHLASSH